MVRGCYHLVVLSGVALVAAHMWLHRKATDGSDVTPQPTLDVRPVI